MRRHCLALLLATPLAAQTTPRQLTRFLEPPLQSPDLVAYQLRHYLRAKVPKLVVPASAQ